MLLKRPNDFILFALVCYIVAMSALILFLTFNKLQALYFSPAHSNPTNLTAP